MKKTVIILLTLTLLLPNFSLVKAEVREATINYLRSQTQSQWITMALAAAGQNNLDLAYLNDFQASTANDYSKTILAVIAAGQNPYNFRNQNLVAGLLGFQANNQLGDASLFNDDFWGVIALRAAGEPINAAVIQNSKNVILQAQQENGGWAWAPNQESDTNDTAAAIMALLDAGQGGESAEIQRAVSYLRSTQNVDGGLPFAAGGQSDGSSDAWVIAALNKLRIDPASWQRDNHNPLSHLESLILENGSFRWLASDQAGNLSTTAFAAVALAGRFYPVAIYQQNNNNNLYHLRIEGATATICDAEVAGTTALNIVENGAQVCGYTYNIRQTDWGPYLERINNEQSAGMSGWLYRVNWLSPQVGAADYRLSSGDEVLWAFGEYPLPPLRLSLSGQQIELNQQVTATVEYFDEQNWPAATGTIVRVGDRTFQTDQNGQAVFTVSDRGIFRVYAEKQGLVRSQKEVLVVGADDRAIVNLRVNVEQPGGGGGGGNDNNGQALAFQINTHDLDFGNLQPGTQAERTLSITNVGQAAIYLEGLVAGDNLFTANLYLDSRNWENYQGTFERGSSRNLSLSLRVPANYQGSGAKQGSLVFWAAAR